MSRDVKLLIGYSLFFTLCNLVVFLFYYLYGYFNEKKLRASGSNKAIPSNLLFLFRFKGIKGKDKLTASRIGTRSQAGAIIYLIVIEALCFILAKIKNDMVISCRFALSMMILFLVCGIVLMIISGRKYKNK